MIQYYCSCEQIKMGQLCRGKQKCVEENKTLEVLYQKCHCLGLFFPNLFHPISFTQCCYTGKSGGK